MEEKQRFITIDGQNISVSEEVYHAYKQPAWRERKQKMRDLEADRTPYSLDRMEEDGMDVSDDDQRVEEIVMQKEMAKTMYRAIDELDPEARIIVLLFSKGVSDHKISEQIGMPQTTVSYRRKVAFKTLREKMKDYR